MRNKSKKKVWSSIRADREFSSWIRKRDGRCVLCGRKPPVVILDCSHYWGRHASSVRYLPENCDAICRGCHFKVESNKQGEYRSFKLKQLGGEKYKELEKIFYQSGITRRDAIIALEQKLKELNGPKNL